MMEIRFLGKYEILDKLGEGGQGVVYKVRNPQLGRVEALKILREDADGAFEEYQRFEREARVLAQIHHPNIVPVYEVGNVDGRPFYTMEYVEGESVASVIKRMGSLPPRAAVKIARDAARALAAAHERGVIHRDIKPHNILICKDEGEEEKTRPSKDTSISLSTGTAARYRVLLSDFGLARVAGEQSLTVESGAILGTVSYMSPEQANAERRRINEKSDVYSLGATIYQMVTGRLPFEADTTLELIRKISVEEAPPPRTMVPGLSKDVETIIQKCLAKEPERRYRLAKLLADDLERWLEGEEISARPAGRAYRLYRRAVRHRAVVIPAAASLLVAAILVFVLGILPGIRRRAEERAALRETLALKRATEAEFRGLLERGEYDRAIDLARPRFGGAPPLDPSSAADPEFAELAQPYDLDLPKAYLLRGRKLSAAGDPRGRGDLANAFRSGQSAPRFRDTAREALLDLAEHLLAENEPERAERTARLCASHFGVDAPRTRGVLARASQRSGRLEDAAALWHSLEDHAEFGAEARGELAFLKIILPRVNVPLPPGAVGAGDLDGDGTPEVCHLGGDGRLSVVRLAGGAWSKIGEAALGDSRGEAPASVVKIVDLDGDGAPEILAAGGSGEQRNGFVAVLQWRDGKAIIVSRASVEANVRELHVLDFDGDGTQDLVALLGTYRRSLWIARIRGAELEPHFEWRVLCDPSGLRVFESGEIVVGLGAWWLRVEHPLLWKLGDSNLYELKEGDAQPWGFRVIALGPAGGGAYVENASCPDRINCVQGAWADDGTLFIGAGRGPPERKILPDLVPGGLYRIRYKDGKFSAAEPIRLLEPGVSLGPVVEVGGTKCLLAGLGADLLAVPVSGRGERAARVGETSGMVHVDFDGDGDREILLRDYNRESGAILGLGSYRRPPMPVVPAATAGEIGSAEPEQELLDVGLFQEAADVCRERLLLGDDPRVRYRLGAGLAGLGEWRDAAEEYLAAARDRGLAPDALLRRANALERVRDWAALGACLEALSDLALGDAYLRGEVARRREWALKAAATAPRLRWEKWDAPAPFLCGNPMKFRAGAEGLDVWSVSDVYGDGGGPLFWYDGDPVRLTFHIRLGETKWATGFRLGLGSARSFGRPEDKVPGPRLAVTYYGSGATPKPVFDLRLEAVSPAGRSWERGLPTDAVELPPEAEYRVVLEYVPGLERAFADIFDAAGNHVATLPPLDLPQGLERGLYVAGQLEDLRFGAGDGSLSTRVRILGIDIDGGSAIRSGEPAPETPRDWLAVASGALVMGDHAAAEAAYEKALKSEEKDVVARAYLFRALLRLREGRESDARADVRAALQADPNVARCLQNEAPAALSKEELAFFRAVLEGR